MPAPRAILHGIDDKSTRQIPYEPTPLAQHTPLLMLMTKRGPVEPMFLNIDGFDIFYDQDSLGENSVWHTHQSELARIALATGNSSVVIKRIVDEFSKTASVCVGKDPVANRIKAIQVDEVVSPVRLASFVPILEYTIANPGHWGNLVGVQIYKSNDKKQNTLGVMLDAVIYEAVVIEEDEVTGSQRVVTNIYGEPATYFTMKRDNIANGVDYFFDEIMKNSYIEDEDKITRPQLFTSFQLHVDTVASLAVTPATYWKEDLLTNIRSDGTNGFRAGLPIFAQGGDDGFHDYGNSLIENRLDRSHKYEAAVKSWLMTIDETNPITDMAQYPFSTLWDSGFTKETKIEFKNILQYRKDVWIAMAVTSVNRYLQIDDDAVFDYQPKLTNQESISLGMYYRTVFTGIPEAVSFGTPTVRATLIGQDGVNRNSMYRKRQTLNIDLFEKVAKYCGSGDGKWKSQYAFDQDGLNTINDWHDLSMDYLSPPVTDDAWDAGLIYVQNKDVKRKFYPTYQTLYPDDTSVLNNIFTMMACCWIEKAHFKGWTMVTGDSKSTNLEIAEKLDQYLNSTLQNAFDGRFITVSKTYYTDTDTANGFSFTTDTTIYSNMTKHTANYKITAHRMSDIL